MKMFMVLMPIIVPFFQTRGLDMKQVYQLQSVFAFGMLIFELPSGYLSDLLGRKKTLIISCVFNGLGWMLFPFSSGFWSLATAELLLAISVSMFSGTDIAVLYDTLEVLNKKRAPIKIMGRRMFYGRMGETVAALIGGWMALLSLELPVISQAFIAWIPLFVVLGITEPDRKLMDKKKHLENAKYIYTKLFKQSKLLSLIILNVIV